MQPDSAPYVIKKRNLLLRLSYDGTSYHGWQVQHNAVTVQSVLQDALFPILGGIHELKGCSRTDSGVHAQEYFVSVQTDARIPCDRLVPALNAALPRDIAVHHCREVPSDFHARYSCSGKEYVYRIWNHPVRNPFWDRYVLQYPRPLDVDLLNRCAQSYVGTHDFSAFCSAGGKKLDPVRTVSRFSVEREGDMVCMYAAADGFLYNMVRIMVGTMLHVAQGRIAPEDLPRIIAERDRSKAGPTAPPQGLTLHRVFYNQLSPV